MSARNGKLTFLDLPSEIRYEIFKLIIPDSYLIGKEHEPLLKVSKQIREECLPFIYGRHNLFLYQRTIADKYIHFATSRAALYLRHIRIGFPCWHRRGTWWLRVEGHLDDDYCIRLGFSRGSSTQATRFRWLRQPVFQALEDWAKTAVRSKGGFTGQDLLYVIQRIGGIRTAERMAMVERSILCAKLTCDGWELEY